MAADLDDALLQLPVIRNVAALPHEVQLQLALRSARRMEQLFEASTPVVATPECLPVIAGLQVALAVAGGTERDVPRVKQAREESKKVSRNLGKRFHSEDHPSRRASAVITRSILASAEFLANDAAFRETIAKTLCATIQAARYGTWMIRTIERDLEGYLQGEPIDLDPDSLWPDGAPEGWPYTVIAHDAFISHCYVDKVPFVDALAAELTRLKFRIWYDTIQLAIGDRLFDRFMDGIAESRYSIVVFSKAWIQKSSDGMSWKDQEFDQVSAEIMRQPEKFLPVWFGVTSDDFFKAKRGIFTRYLAWVGTDPIECARTLATRMGGSQFFL